MSLALTLIYIGNAQNLHILIEPSMKFLANHINVQPASEKTHLTLRVDSLATLTLLSLLTSTSITSLASSYN
jgi:hypothetical protein